MIFFNVVNARKELLDKGVVYTLRSEFRATGKTQAVVGGMYKHDVLCLVEVSRVLAVQHQDDLLPYLPYSGFDNVNNWLTAAKPTARTLYRVVRIEE